MSRFNLSPGMADFLSQYRRSRYEEGSAERSDPSYYDSTPRPIVAQSSSFIPPPPVPREELPYPDRSESAFGPAQLRLMDQMSGFLPLAPGDNPFAGAVDPIGNNPNDGITMLRNFFRRDQQPAEAAPVASPAQPAATGGYGAFMMPGWDGRPAAAAPERTMSTPRNDLPTSAGGYGAFMMPGWDGQGAQAPALPPDLPQIPLLPAPGSPTPEPMVGPIAQERLPWQSTITTGSGVVTTQYPQIGDNQFGTGQVVSDTRSQGPKSIQDMFRDRFTELRRDQSYGLFGMPADSASRLANMEMQPALAEQELAARSADLDANRRLQMQLEQSRIDAGKYDRQQALQSDIAKAGINAAGSGQLGPFLRDMQAFNSATGGRVLGPSAPVAAAGSMPAGRDEVSPDERGRRLIQQLAPLLPKTFQYVAPGAGRDRVAMTGTAEALDPTALPEIFNRLAGAGLDEPAMRSFLGALRTSQGGQEVYERLLSQSFADDIAARNQPTTQRGLLSRFMSLPAISMFSGGAGASTYPAQINFEDFPGTTATAVPDKSNIDRLGRSLRSGGMPNYTLTTPTGMTLPLPVRDSLSGDMNRIKAQEQMRLLLRRVGLSAQ